MNHFHTSERFDCSWPSRRPKCERTRLEEGGGTQPISYQAVYVFYDCAKCSREIIWNGLNLNRDVEGNHTLRGGSPRDRDRPLGCIYKQSFVMQLRPLATRESQGRGRIPPGRWTVDQRKRLATEGKNRSSVWIAATGQPIARAELTGWSPAQSPSLPPHYPHTPTAVCHLPVRKS